VKKVIEGFATLKGVDLRNKFNYQKQIILFLKENKNQAYSKEAEPTTNFEKDSKQLRTYRII
jgi:hypothetical protein